MFFFKKDKIIVDCFTANQTAYEFYPIEKSNKYIPEWWKQLPVSKELPTARGGMAMEQSSIKRCSGFTNLYTRGYILPLWSDLQVSTSTNGYEYMFANTVVEPGIERHNEWQYGESFNDYWHMKIFSPWMLKQHNKCEFAMIPVIWNNPENWSNFTVLPGVVDFKHQHSTNINLFFEKDRPKVLISAGTPLYQIIPLTDLLVEFKIHLVDPLEIDRLNKRNAGTFLNTYNNTKKIDLKKEKTCPFGFLK
jgi:hypothetical protein